MSLYQLEGAASLALLGKAEAALHEAHKVPQSLLNQELAQVLRTRVERALADNNAELAAASLKQLQTCLKPMTLTASLPTHSMAQPEPCRSLKANLQKP